MRDPAAAGKRTDTADAEVSTMPVHCAARQQRRNKKAAVFFLPSLLLGRRRAAGLPQGDVKCTRLAPGASIGLGLCVSRSKMPLQGQVWGRHADGKPGARRENIETLSAGGIYCAPLWFPDLLQEVIPSGIYPHLITNTFRCCSLFVFRRSSSVAEVLSG